MSNDWIEHTGGPQPVGDDVWVQVWRKHSGHDRSPSMAAGFNWPDSVRSFRILNQHLIDAARLEGIRLGLEAAARACQAQAEEFLSPSYAVDQPLSSFAERFACGRCADEIRNLNPDTIAREAKDD